MLLGKLIWKEKWWILLSMLEIVFVTLFFAYVGGTAQFSGKIMELSLPKDYVAYQFDIVSSNQAMNYSDIDSTLKKWIDEKEKACSFILSETLQDHSELVIAIGKSSIELFGKGELELGNAYISSKADNYGKKNILISTFAGSKEYPLYSLDQDIDYMIVSKGVKDLKNQIILCISYADYEKYFGGYYKSEVLNNICLVTLEKDSNLLEEFIIDVKEVGCTLVPYNWQAYIQEYWGSMNRTSLFCTIFYIMVLAFVIYSVYMNMMILLRRRAYEFTIQYLCGEDLYRVRMRVVALLCILWIPTILNFGMLMIWLPEMLVETENTYVIIGSLLMILITTLVYQIGNIFQESKMEFYLKETEHIK